MSDFSKLWDKVEKWVDGLKDDLSFEVKAVVDMDSDTFPSTPHAPQPRFRIRWKKLGDILLPPFIPSVWRPTARKALMRWLFQYAMKRGIIVTED